MPKIDDYDFGRIVVDGLEQTRDVILLPGRVVLNWWRQDDREMVRKQVLPKPAPSLTTHVLHRPLGVGLGWLLELALVELTRANDDRSRTCAGFRRNSAAASAAARVACGRRRLPCRGALAAAPRRPRSPARSAAQCVGLRVNAVTSSRCGRRHSSSRGEAYARRRARVARRDPCRQVQHFGALRATQVHALRSRPTRRLRYASRAASCRRRSTPRGLGRRPRSPSRRYRRCFPSKHSTCPSGVAPIRGPRRGNGRARLAGRRGRRCRSAIWPCVYTNQPPEPLPTACQSVIAPDSKSSMTIVLG
jgi:hypothetical protein